MLITLLNSLQCSSMYSSGCLILYLDYILLVWFIFVYDLSYSTLAVIQKQSTASEDLCQKRKSNLIRNMVCHPFTQF